MAHTIEAIRNNPYVRDAHQLRRNMSSLAPESPRPGEMFETSIREQDTVYTAFETTTHNVGTSIPHLLQLNEVSKYQDEHPVKFSSIYIQEEGGREYHFQKDPVAKHTWTVQVIGEEHAYKLDLGKTSPFIVSHEFSFGHSGKHGEELKSRKIKNIIVVDKAQGTSVPHFGEAIIEDNNELKEKVRHIKVDKHGKDPEHVQRTIKLPARHGEVRYVAGYHPYERNEGLHKHESRNELQILEGAFEICVFDVNKWKWGPHFIAGPGYIFHLDPMTPHLVAPAEDRFHPWKLSIIKITTAEAVVNIDPGQGYNISVEDDHLPPMPPLEHGRRHSA